MTDDHHDILAKQKAWQKRRIDKSWLEKIREAEALRSSIISLKQSVKEDTPSYKTREKSD